MLYVALRLHGREKIFSYRRAQGYFNRNVVDVTAEIISRHLELNGISKNQNFYYRHPEENHSLLMSAL